MPDCNFFAVIQGNTNVNFIVLTMGFETFFDFLKMHHHLKFTFFWGCCATKE